eukprot:6113741-Lingulodinium_polyedra.AAC.1
MWVRGAAQERFSRAISVAQDAVVTFVFQAVGAHGDQKAYALQCLECYQSRGAAVDAVESIANGVVQNAVSQACWRR